MAVPKTPIGPDGRFLPRFDPGATERACRDCGQTKPLEDFRRDKTGTAGRASFCKECYREKSRAHYHANVEAERTRSREKGRRSRRESPETSNPWVPIQRARKHGCHIESRYLVPLAVLEMDDGICGICGEDVDPFDFHVDHIIPCSKGGEHSYANVQVAHPKCNQRKNERVLLDA